MQSTRYILISVAISRFKIQNTLLIPEGNSFDLLKFLSIQTERKGTTTKKDLHQHKQKIQNKLNIHTGYVKMVEY